MDNVYVVTYWKEELNYEPVVTVFNNEDAAQRCKSYFNNRGFETCVDKCEIFSNFKEDDNE